MISSHAVYGFLLLAVSLVSCGISVAANAQNYSPSCDAQATDDLKQDCSALESLYDETGGASWTNNTKWKTSDPLDDWHGVTVPVATGRVQELNLFSNNLSGTIPDLSALTGVMRLAYWGNPDLDWTSITLASGKDTVIDSTALRGLYSATGRPDWKDSTNWLSDDVPLDDWYGVTTDDSSGRVTVLNLAGNGLENEVSNSLEVLTALESLNFSDNANLSGTLPERLKEISGLSSLNIRCTDVGTPSSNEFNTWLSGLGSGFMKDCTSLAACASGVTGFRASGSFVSHNDGSSEFQIKGSWDEIPNATYTISWEDSPRLGFSGVVGPADKSYYETDGDKISYTIFGHYSNDAPARVTYTISVTAVVDGCEDLSYGPVTVSTGGSAAPAPGGDNSDDTCPDYSPVVTAQDVERAKDPGTLAAFVKEARIGVGTLLRNAVSEGEGIRNLAECFGADGDWKHGSVHLFMISADENRNFFLAPGDSELVGAPLDVEDENGCDVGEEILRAARARNSSAMTWVWRGTTRGRVSCSTCGATRTIRTARTTICPG